jgi:hypothetical protein
MYFLGLDLGQKRDHSAIAVVERIDHRGKLLVRHLERLPLGTPYPKVVERMTEIVQSRSAAARWRWMQPE